MATRYSGNVQIRLQYHDDGCYHGRVRVNGHSYSVTVNPPASGYGPGVAYDSPVAYDHAAHAMLSFAAEDMEWHRDGCPFTPEAEPCSAGWVIRRQKSGPPALNRHPDCLLTMGCLCAFHARGGDDSAACNATD